MWLTMAADVAITCSPSHQGCQTHHEEQHHEETRLHRTQPRTLTSPQPPHMCRLRGNTKFDIIFPAMSALQNLLFRCSFVNSAKPLLTTIFCVACKGILCEDLLFLLCSLPFGILRLSFSLFYCLWLSPTSGSLAPIRPSGWYQVA
jgi:hypothetical protein